LLLYLYKDISMFPSRMPEEVKKKTQDFELTARGIERIDSYVKRKIAGIKEKLEMGRQCTICHTHQK
jgi:hypothetical protein